MTTGVSPSLPSTQASACCVSAAASGVASASSSSVGTCSRAVPIWNNVAREHDPASTAAAPAASGSAPGSGRAGQQTGAAEILRQADRHAGSTGNQRVAFRRLSDRVQILIRHRVHDAVTPALFLQRRHGAANGGSTLMHRGERHQTHRPRRLAGQHTHQIGIGHRRQRMVFHAALVQQRGADEQMALEDAAAIGREGRAGEGEAAIQTVQQRVRHRPDIALIGGIEGRAVFEEELPAPRAAQPFQRGQAVPYRLARPALCGISAPR